MQRKSGLATLTGNACLVLHARPGGWLAVIGRAASPSEKTARGSIFPQVRDEVKWPYAPRFVDVIVYWVRGWPERRLAMNDVHGWFSDNKLWIEFIIATVVLWLLMTAVSVFDLRSAG